MKRSIRVLGLSFCIASLTFAGNALATSSEKLHDGLDEQTDQPAERSGRKKDCHLFFLKGDLGVQEAGMDAGEPIHTLHLFITNADGKLVKNAQVVTTLIDHQGKQLSYRALPFKGGYLLALEHLSAGQYLVEAEIVTKGQLLTEMFRFHRA